MYHNLAYLQSLSCVRSLTIRTVSWLGGAGCCFTDEPGTPWQCKVHIVMRSCPAVPSVSSVITESYHIHTLQWWGFDPPLQNINSMIPTSCLCEKMWKEYIASGMKQWSKHMESHRSQAFLTHDALGFLVSEFAAEQLGAPRLLLFNYSQMSLWKISNRFNI